MGILVIRIVRVLSFIIMLEVLIRILTLVQFLLVEEMASFMNTAVKVKCNKD